MPDIYHHENPFSEVVQQFFQINSIKAQEILINTSSGDANGALRIMTSVGSNVSRVYSPERAHARLVSILEGLDQDGNNIKF